MRPFFRTPMILMALAPLALAGAVAGPAAGATAASAVPPPACSAWDGTQPVNPAANSVLSGIAVISPCDMWAVGVSSGSPSSPDQLLLEHWSGSFWVRDPRHLPGSSALSEISAVSANDIWAVGTTSPDGSTPANLLLLNYDGITWFQFDSPIAAPDGLTVLSLDARAEDDAWLAGSTGRGPVHSMLLHWDGSNWSPSAIPPEFAGDDTEVTGVSADSATDAWAAGNGPGFGNFMLRWDGSHWNPVDIPVPASTTLTGVTALSPDNAWAVGYTNPTSGPQQPVIMRWDGSHWAPMTSPNVGGAAGSRLDEVTAASATNVFVRASYLNASSRRVTVVLHWDGSSWAASALPLPGQGAGDIINSIGVSAAGQAWIAGSTGLNGKPLTTVAAPVPVVPDVTGDQVGAANATPGTFGLTGNSVLDHTTNCPASSWGLVVSSDPVAGQEEPFGFGVRLTVCTPVIVPSVLSQGDQDAQNAITAAGLTVGPVTMRANCTEPHGAVLVQNPDPGVQVTPGTAVSLVESTGRQPNGHLCVIN
jgi:hypothetical protein